MINDAAAVVVADGAVVVKEVDPIVEASAAVDNKGEVCNTDEVKRSKKPRLGISMSFIRRNNYNVLCACCISTITSRDVL